MPKYLLGIDNGSTVSKATLVTGGSRGLLKTICLSLAAEGAKVAEKFSQIDILVNNAAVCPTCWGKDMSKQMLDQTISVNLTGTFLAVLDKSEQLMYNYVKLWNGVSWQWLKQTLWVNFLSDCSGKIVVVSA